MVEKECYFMDSIGQRIKNARKNASLTQLELAEKTKLSRSYIGDIEKDRYNPSVSTLELIAAATGVPASKLLSTSGQTPTPPRGVRIPILGKVVAGIPLEAITDIDGWEEISPKMAASGEYFALRIKGLSMEPKLHEGDIVIVKRQSDVESGDTAIILVDGEDATVKQIKKNKEGIMLIGLNIDVYPPHFYTNREIADLPVQIIGKVVESRHTW
jgi:repressor LexA